MADKTLDALAPIDAIRSTDLVTISRKGVPSMNMTVAELQAWLTDKINPDQFSELIEHLVPNKTHIDEAGKKRPVYGRRYIGAFPTTGDTVVFGPYLSSPVCIQGTVERGEWSDRTILPTPEVDVRGNGQNGVVFRHDGSLKGKRYNIYVEYVRLG